MAFLEIRVPTAIAVFLIVLGLPASGAFLLLGWVVWLTRPTRTGVSWPPWCSAVWVCSYC